MPEHKLQRCSGSNKLMRCEGSRKLRRCSEPVHCPACDPGTTPQKIQVWFYGTFASCNCTPDMFGSSLWYRRWTAGPYILSRPDPKQAPCYYSRFYEWPFSYQKRYGDKGCSEYLWDRLHAMHRIAVNYSFEQYPRLDIWASYNAGTGSPRIDPFFYGMTKHDGNCAASIGVHNNFDQCEGPEEFGPPRPAYAIVEAYPAFRRGPAIAPPPAEPGVIVPPKPGVNMDWTPRDESRGLGDSVAKLTSKLRIKPCGGCKDRQATLNGWWPYKNNTED